MLELYEQLARERGGFVPLKVWTKNVYLITDADLLEELLVKKHKYFEKSAGLRAVKPSFFGDGLLTAGSGKWRGQQKIIRPAFSAKLFDGYSATMERLAAEQLAGWRDGATIDVHAEMISLCLNILAETLFGEDAGTLREPLARTAAAVQRFANERSYFLPLPRWFPTELNREVKSATAALDREVTKLIHRRSNLLSDDLLSMMIRSRMEERQLRDEIVTMLLAGHETAASALSWTFYLLGRNPRVGDKLAESIYFGRGEYAEQVLKESMRLYPPVYRIGRTAMQDVEIGPHKLEAGAEILIPQWALHRSPKYFARPQEFLPERWTEDMEANLPRCAYLPFGAGPRGCMGNRFVMMEDLIILRAIAGKYRFHSTSEVKPYQGLTLIPAGSTLPLQISLREVRCAA